VVRKCKPKKPDAPTVLVVQGKLVLDEAPRDSLLSTMERMNAAANWLAPRAFEHKLADKRRLQRLFYYDMRADFGLPSQMAIRTIAKVCDAYVRDRSICPTFRPRGSVAYDTRLYSFKKESTEITLTTLDGRIRCPILFRDADRERLLSSKYGEADLVFRDNEFYLLVSVSIPYEKPAEPVDFLGVDLGVVNITTDSDGTVFAGDHLNVVRERYANTRSKLQSVGTKSAKRLLKKRRRKEMRFARDTNHRVSKKIVTRAKDTGRGIALEDLTGIRERTTVRKAQRRVRSSWSFAQLRGFVTYKACLAGVALMVVDPRNTSRTCPACGFVSKANRKSQAVFECVWCGHAGHADTIAAQNISRRGLATYSAMSLAAVTRPDASSVGGTYGHLHVVTQVQSLGL